MKNEFVLTSVYSNELINFDETRVLRVISYCSIAEPLDEYTSHRAHIIFKKLSSYSILNQLYFNKTKNKKKGKEIKWLLKCVFSESRIKQF